MHDGNSPGTDAAIARHGGEATTVRQRYDHPTPMIALPLYRIANLHLVAG